VQDRDEASDRQAVVAQLADVDVTELRPLFFWSLSHGFGHDLPPLEHTEKILNLRFPPILVCCNNI
jgi:hypothetical protein